MTKPTSVSLAQSGEPYITHPVAVAEICAGWKLDAQAIMAALLHDVMEDQGVTKDELTEQLRRQGRGVGRRVVEAGKRSEFQSQRKRRRKTSARCCWRWRATCA